jgi:hypothetical protein
MPATTVNSLTLAQLNGLSMSQLSALNNSPYYASFSSAIKSDLTSLSANSKATVSTTKTIVKNNGFKLRINLISLFSCSLFTILNNSLTSNIF